MRRLTSNFCAAALLLAAQAPLALATPVYSEPQLDQYSFLQPGPTGVAYLTSPNEEFRRAQSFTVGIGGQLDRIVVHFNQSAPDWGPGAADQMRLLSMSTGVPGDILATSSARTLTTLNLPDNEYVLGTFDFSGFGLNFNVGDLLAFEIIHDGGAQWYQDTYAGGSDFIINPPFYDDWSALTDIDLGFQTYVGTRGTAVPEPSILWLLAAALAAVVLQRGRWQRG